VGAYRETGDRHGEGRALNNLGLALLEVRRFEEAISAHQDAAAI
jgi:Flp pilus assembly protein TadD